MIVISPLWYIPHICLQQLLWILDNNVSHSNAIAFAILLAISRTGVDSMMMQLNMYVSLKCLSLMFQISFICCTTHQSAYHFPLIPVST